MKKRGKKYLEAVKNLDTAKLHESLPEAVKALKEVSYTNFDATVDVGIYTNLNPRKPDQQIRGSIALPHGTGKTVRVAVFASGEKLKEAEEAGADYVGGEDLVDKVKDGFMDFEAAIATPDMMRHLGKIGKLLGPRGLMPTPKTGTVTMDIAKAVEDIKAGKINYKVERHGNIHLIAGKTSFDEKALVDNLKAILETIVKSRPASLKGSYIKKIALSPTMGPSILLDVNAVYNMFR